MKKYLLMIAIAVISTYVYAAEQDAAVQAASKEGPGKTEPVKVWELLGTADLQMTENQKQSLEIYHEGLRLYRERSWPEAIAYFQQAKQLDPTCRVSEIYEQRANLYQLNPPPADWVGVFVMTTK